MKTSAILAALLCVASTSCTAFGGSWFSDGTVRGVELAESTSEDGTNHVWRAYPGQETRPRVEKTTTRIVIEPYFGIVVSDLDQQRAREVGATAWRGVYVAQVVEGGPCDRAGLVRGDVVLEVNGIEATSTQQFLEVIAQECVPDEPTEFTLWQQRRPGTPIDAPSVTTATVTPQAKKVRKTTTDSFPLEESEGVQTYTGLQVATVEADLAREIYGDSGSVALVTGVVTGSPAYEAGLRAGDRVVRVDGEPIESMDAVREAVAARVQGAFPGQPKYDLTRARPPARNDAIRFEVDGPLGPHLATVEVSDEIGDRTRFYIPVVAHYSSASDRTKFGFLNFILQLGFNYSSRVHASDSRTPVETSSLSILPFGMFEIEHGKTRSNYTLFWLINFGFDR